MSRSLAEFQPLADQIVVQLFRKLERYERKSQSGLIFLPDNPQRDKKREFFYFGRVVKAGPGDAYREGSPRKDGSRACYAAPDGRFPMHVKEGDVVAFERRPHAVHNFDGLTHVILHEEQHVVCVIEDYQGDTTPVAYDPRAKELVV